MANDPYAEFRRAVACPDQKIELARAALTIAAGEYPNLLIAEYLSRIDLLAAEVAERIGQERNVYRSIAGLNHVLFQRHGYRGNLSEYFDPKNSFLNEVMERREGFQSRYRFSTWKWHSGSDCLFLASVFQDTFWLSISMTSRRL
jgi:hypothetical protein